MSKYTGEKWIYGLPIGVSIFGNKKILHNDFEKAKCPICNKLMTYQENCFIIEFACKNKKCKGYYRWLGGIEKSFIGNINIEKEGKEMKNKEDNFGLTKNEMNKIGEGMSKYKEGFADGKYKQIEIIKELLLKKDREFMSFLKSLMRGKDYSIFPSTSIKRIQDKILELSIKGKINIQKSNRTESENGKFSQSRFRKKSERRLR